MDNTSNLSLQELKASLIQDLKNRVDDRILEESNFLLLEKLINNASDKTEAIAIAELGTTYKRTGFHFDKKLERLGTTIKYLKRNDELSFSSVNDSDLTHKLIIGDNYDALLNLSISHKGKIDVIYIDPPYGKDDMGAFAETNYNNAITRDNLLSMLYSRLILAKQLLSEEGVIFCSIDDKNQAYVKCLFDDVFGEGKFVCNCIWRKKTGASDAKGIAVITEYILVYCKAYEVSQWNDIFSQNYESFDKNRYRCSDEYEKERGKYYPDNLDRGGLNYSDSMNFGIECPDGQIVFPNGRKHFENDGWIWKWGKAKVEWGIKHGFIEFRKKKNDKDWSVCYKNYLYVDNENNPINRSAPFKNLIEDVLNGKGSNDLKSIMDCNCFKNPKPFNLIIYLIKSVFKKDITVLDFFAGSGTTGQAVLELNKEDGGNRTFILCTNNEITEKNPNGIAYDVTSKRLKRVMTGKCYDGTDDFEWIKKNEALGGNLEVMEIAEVSNIEQQEGLSAFDVINEKLYGQDFTLSVEDKIRWVCENFSVTQKYLAESKSEV